MNEIHKKYISAAKVFCLMISLFILFQSPIYAAIKKSDKELISGVTKKLLASIKGTSKHKINTPVFSIEESDLPNSYTDISLISKNKFVITITSKMLNDFIRNNPSKLAYVISHELAHILLGHLKKAKYVSSEIIKQFINRESEKAADIEGLKLALGAGYSYSEILKLLKELKSSGDLFPLESLSSDHPTWTHRLEYLDSAKSNLWRATSAFENGVYFLFFENYETAAICFQKVTDEFPDCYEAYSNTGYAYLMRYMEGFDVEDIKRYNIGQFAVDGFYRRAGSLEEKTKGIDEDLWAGAVYNFKKALRIKKDLALVKSNLGIAYLLDPLRKSSDKSKKCFDESLELVERDSTLNSFLKAVIYFNAGVSNMAWNKLSIALGNFRSANNFFNSIDSHSKYFSSSNSFPGSSIYSAIKLNYTTINNARKLNNILVGIRQEDGKLQKANLKIDLLEYLQTTNHTSIWWSYAYDLYVKVCKNNSEEPEERNSLIHIEKDNHHPITSLRFANKNEVYLSEKMKDIIHDLGNYENVSIVSDRRISKYIFKKNNIEIIGSDEADVIIITGNSIPFSLKMNKNTSQKILIGMRRTEIERIFHTISSNKITINGLDEVLSFYNEVGIAFCYSADKVEKIILVQSADVYK